MRPLFAPVAAAGLAALLAALAGCQSGYFSEGISRYQRVAESWVGAPVSELRAAWGSWDGTRNLAGGGEQIVYSHSNVLAGTEIGCEARFTVSAAGLVTRAQVIGTIGGCRQLLGDAQPRGAP